jgi:N-acetyl-gamma-glutamylphosphate reductase
MNNYSVAIVGVTGYSGREADRLLKFHPSIKVSGRFTSKGDGSGIQAYSLEAVKQSRPDVVITATEHEVSLRIVPELFLRRISCHRHERGISDEGFVALPKMVWL